MKKTKFICMNAMGIALFVALSLCLQVPIFENYYLCLGYFVMTAFLYIMGPVSGTLVGTLGVILYCVITGGLRGMPGWVLGNLIIGVILGLTFKAIKKVKKPLIQIIIAYAVTLFSVALGILVVKSGVESFLYSLPFLVRAATNIYAFVADAIMIIVSIPVIIAIEPKINDII